MDVISVVVPVYNVEQYLSKCLDSIIAQTYSDLEIIVVDDGSTDDSNNICDFYKKQDSRIQVIHKENGGLSDARNVGIDIATGKYICFVDSDDYIEKDYVAQMYEQIRKYCADICCCGKIVECRGKKSVINSSSQFVVNSVDVFKYYLQKKEIDNSAVDKLYRRELFDNVRFPVGRCYEDIGTIYKIFLKANTIVHIDVPLYHYVVRSGSISHGHYSEKQMDSFYMTKEAVDYIGCVHPELKEYLNAYYGLELVTTIRRLYYYIGKKETERKYADIIEEYTNNFELFVFNPYIPFTKKIMMWLVRYRLCGIVNIMVRLLKRNM